MPIINNSSLSFEEIKADILAWINTLPSTPVRNSFASKHTASAILLDLLAANAAHKIYAAVKSRSEAYLLEASLRSSAIGIVEALGYSTNRGRNATFYVTVVPASGRTSTVILPAYTVLGTVGNYDLITLPQPVSNFITSVDVVITAGNNSASFNLTDNVVAGSAVVTVTETVVGSDSIVSTGYDVAISATEGTITGTRFSTTGTDNVFAYADGVLSVVLSSSVASGETATVSITYQYDLPVVATSATFPATENTRVLCTLGTLKTETIVSTTADLEVFRFISSDVSSDIQLYKDPGTSDVLDGTNVTDHSEFLIDLQNDKYVFTSNPVGGVDLRYFNTSTTATDKYVSGTVFTLKYVGLLPTQRIVESDIDITYSLGSIVVDSYVLETDFVDVEPLSDIKVNAPLYHETMYQVRGRDDEKKLLKTMDSRFISTNQRNDPLQVAQTEVTYLIYDGSAQVQLSSYEEAAINAKLDGSRPFGVAAPTFIQANAVTITMIVTVYYYVGTSPDISGDIATILSAYEKNLDLAEIDFFQIENDINALPYIKRLRIDLDQMESNLATNYVYANSANASSPLSQFTKTTGKLALDWNEYVIFAPSDLTGINV